MSINKNIQNAIKTIVEQAISTAPFDKTRGGIIKKVDEANTYSVQIDGVVYSKVKALNGASFNVGDMVHVIFPTNNVSQMVINGISSKCWANPSYPIGSYYWTSDSAFNPKNVFGGEWEQSMDGQKYCWHRIS